KHDLAARPPSTRRRTHDRTTNDMPQARHSMIPLTPRPTAHGHNHNFRTEELEGAIVGHKVPTTPTPRPGSNEGQQQGIPTTGTIPKRCGLLRLILRHGRRTQSRLSPRASQLPRGRRGVLRLRDERHRVGKVVLDPTLLALPSLARLGPRRTDSRPATIVTNSLIHSATRGTVSISHGLSHGRLRHLLRRGRHHSRHRHRVLLHPSTVRRRRHVPVQIEIRNRATHTHHHLEGWWG